MLHPGGERVGPAASTIRSSLKSLLITSRIRGVPASGARVMERSPPAAIRPASSGVMASTRSDDGLKLPPASPMKQVSGSSAGVVAGVGPDQPDPLPGRDPLPHLAAQGLEVHLAVGALHEAGGAEAAAPQAATRHLGEEEVAELGVGRLDDPRGGHRGEVGHEAAAPPLGRPVERREAGHPAARARVSAYSTS